MMIVDEVFEPQEYFDQEEREWAVVPRKREHHTYSFAYLIDNGERDLIQATTDIQTMTRYRDYSQEPAEGISYWGDLTHRRDGPERVQRYLQAIREQHLLQDVIELVAE